MEEVLRREVVEDSNVEEVEEELQQLSKQLLRNMNNKWIRESNAQLAAESSMKKQQIGIYHCVPTNLNKWVSK
jgi:hypothetical protein